MERVADADWSNGRLNVLACAQPEAVVLSLGQISPAAGRASIAFCGAAIKAALTGDTARE